MKPSPRHARPAALALAATLLLLLLAPSAIANIAAAQRRRSAPRKPAPPAASPAAATPSEPQRPQPQDVERPFDTSVAADNYVVYVELRGLGQLARAGEVRTALDALRLLGEAPREVTDLIDFLTANEEALATVRVVAALMPTRAGLPDGVTALQFPTPEAARAFEPKLRALFDNIGDALGQQPGAAPPQPKGRAASRRARQAKKTPPVVLKRAGSWIYAAPAPFTFKSLKGDGAQALADNPRLQSFRGRLASETLFVYYETPLWRRAWQLQHDETLKKQAELERAAETTATTVTTNEPAVAAIRADPALIPDDRTIAYGDPKASPSPPSDIETTVTVEGVTPTPEEAATPEAEAALAEMEAEAARAEAEKAAKAAESAPPSPKSAEERAARAMMTTLLNGIFGGMMREPEALAVGLNLEGDVLVARLLVARAPDAPNNIIPFFPNVVAGPPVTTESLSVASADSEVFVSASFDWPRIYDSLISTMNTKPPRHDSEAHGGDGRETPGGEESDAVMRPASAEKGVEAMEKLFGFRLKDDLLPALGSEVALSVPADWFEGRRRFITETDEPGADGEKKAAAGPVAIIALNNPDAARKMMPLVLAALGFGSQPQPSAPPERRKGIDIHHLGGPAYAFVGNFLVAGETAPAVRHVVDSYAANRTLAASTRFREATAWQEQQRLAVGYLSDELMRKYIDSTRKMADGSTDPVVLAALAQLDVPPVPASYSTTDVGDALLHELHLPVVLAKIFAASTVISIKEAPVLSTESAVVYSLRRIHAAQLEYKSRGRFGSLEELYEAKLLDQDAPLSEEYAYELRVSGDKFTLTATPKNYGKTGRRSFYIDETGLVRGANHNGRPATAADPPVEP